MTSPVIQFEPSSPDTIGMEIELQLLNAKNLDLVDGIVELMEFYPGVENVKPEFIQNTVEISSSICSSVEELEEEMRNLAKGVYERCLELDMRLCGAGTHPFSTKLASITPRSRYLNMAAREGYTSRTQITFATHVHLGMGSGDEAIRVMRGLKKYLPLLVALSANSPFCYGHDTNYAAYRHYILASTRSYGIPPSFYSWKEFEQFMAVTTQEEIFSSVNDIHWDIRPRPHLGTLEIRVMDAQATITDAVALGAFVKMLADYLRDHEEKESAKNISLSLHQWIEKDNHFKAAHFGLQTEVYDEFSDCEIGMVDFYQACNKKLEKATKHLKLEKYQTHLQEKVRQKGSDTFQREAFRRSGSYEGVVEALARTFKKDILRNG